MSSFPQINIDISLVLLRQLLFGWRVLRNNIIRLNPATQFLVSFLKNFSGIFQFRFPFLIVHSTFSKETKFLFEFGA